jgi:hypothetical protein
MDQQKLGAAVRAEPFDASGIPVVYGGAMSMAGGWTAR